MPETEDPTEDRSETPSSGDSLAEGSAPITIVSTPEEEPLDLTKSAAAARVDLREAPPYSPEWAKIIRPITTSLLALIAAVMLLPFLIIVLAEKEKAGNAIDWAKTVLPPVVGFGGALVGYYFGTRGTQQDGPSEE